MINKIKSLSRKQWYIILGSLLLIIVLVIMMCTVAKQHTASEINYEISSKIKVTDEEMREYRERIGSDMDIKKSYLILFEDEQSCRTFIEEHGDDQNPTAAGIGIIPMMEDGYYNIVGKHTIEEAFDLLADGEYSKEPVVYSNMYCYLRRIGIESPLNNDESLKEFIRNEKYQQLQKVGD